MFVCIPTLSSVCYFQNILIVFKFTTILLIFINYYVTVLNFLLYYTWGGERLVYNLFCSWEVFSALLWALRNFFTCFFHFVTCLTFLVLNFFHTSQGFLNVPLLITPRAFFIFLWLSGSFSYNSLLLSSDAMAVLCLHSVC